MLVALKTTSAQACSAEDFACSNGQCISITNVCDGVQHCSDNSDETRCAQIDMEECPPLYTNVSGRCLHIDIVTGTWFEMHYRCREIGGVMVEVDDANFFYDLVNVLKQQFGLESSYVWNTTGTFIAMGSPFWAVYDSGSSTGDYSQEPMESAEAQYVYLNKDRFLYFSAGDAVGVADASVVCQLA
ncbi:hypothetical protein HAZT_HAZT007477 [Hyalella azteca]|uniref:C-type lectin domain-containing protein n=1 Tax=Hyalella azteca TaxID=294128 RepID=A0A6A0HE20_HYAAZ|nr:hypothetical protein HAZT_HAZT007477 [Hyalella azteca]